MADAGAAATVAAPASVAAVHSSVWHAAFFTEVTNKSSVAAQLNASRASGHSHTAAACTAALLEAVGYSKAASALPSLLSPQSEESTEATLQLAQEPNVASWSRAMSVATLQHAHLLFSSQSAAAGVLPTLVHAALTELHKSSSSDHSGGKTQAGSPSDALLTTLALDYLQHASSKDRATSFSSLPHANAYPVLHLTPSHTADSSSSLTSADRAASARHQRLWYEARLYAAAACATSLAAPGPLARLLVAYAHQADGRLLRVMEENVDQHRTAASATADSSGSNVTAVAFGNEEETKESGGATAQQACVRLSGVVAGVLEYALHVARVRSAETTAALNAPSSKQTVGAGEQAGESLAKVPQSVALLLVQMVEECGYYHQTNTRSSSHASSASTVPAREAALDSTATSIAAAAVVHAVQELLFTVVLGGATSHMTNRPDPAPAKKGGAASVEGIADSSAALFLATARTTTCRGLSLPEADAVVQEVFPSLVHQLGLEWVWSPLLRHLASLDKLTPAAGQASAAAAENKAKAETSPPGSSMLTVRWSSHALMDMVLLCLARKSYPQRLLNILPGSYERLLQQLDLLPPLTQQQDAGDGAETAGTAAAPAGSSSHPALFHMPVYYAEPAAQLVAYFQRAGVAGLRLEEVSRILATSTSSHAMVVRLKAQAPPLTQAGRDEGNEEEDVLATSGGAGDEHAAPQKPKGSATHVYALSCERAQHLVARFEAEVLLAAVVVHTQLRIPSQVQQLMRALAPLFLKLHLDWRSHHNGSVAAWLLQPSTDAGMGTRSARFTREAAVLMDHVGYEFYPLEWLPSLAADVCMPPSPSVESAPLFPSLPYSLWAAVGHQFGLRLRGTPQGSSGGAALRHPAGPRASAVTPAVDDVSLLLPGQADGGGVDSATAWRRCERFLGGLMHVCYLDAKTSSTELEGTLAVSSTRRVLTSSDGASHGGVGGGGGVALTAAADIAAQRLRSLLQQPDVMDAMWGSMEAAAQREAASTSGGKFSSSVSRGARNGGGGGSGGGAIQRSLKRSRSGRRTGAEAAAEAASNLAAMRQLLLDYGAASFDTTVEAADFALLIAQSFLPSTAGVAAMSSGGRHGAPEGRGKRSEQLLQRALEWCRAAVAPSASKARINMILQQQQQREVAGPSSTSSSPLAQAYNSVTVDAAWLARSALRQVPVRILEKLRLQQSQKRALGQRLSQWESRLAVAPATAAEAAGVKDKASAQPRAAAAEEVYSADPLLLEQWRQWTRILQQLGLADLADDNGVVDSPPVPLGTAESADAISCVQWLWYSPYFAAEWSKP